MWRPPSDARQARQSPASCGHQVQVSVSSSWSPGVRRAACPLGDLDARDPACNAPDSSLRCTRRTVEVRRVPNRLVRSSSSAAERYRATSLHERFVLGVRSARSGARHSACTGVHCGSGRRAVRHACMPRMARTGREREQGRTLRLWGRRIPRIRLHRSLRWPIAARRSLCRPQSAITRAVATDTPKAVPLLLLEEMERRSPRCTQRGDSHLLQVYTPGLSTGLRSPANR